MERTVHLVVARASSSSVGPPMGCIEVEGSTPSSRPPWLMPLSLAGSVNPRASIHAEELGMVLLLPGCSWVLLGVAGCCCWRPLRYPLALDHCPTALRAEGALGSSLQLLAVEPGGWRNMVRVWLRLAGTIRLA